MRLKEGQAGGGGRVDGTYNLCSGPKTLCKLWPTSLPLCPLCIPEQIAFCVFCWKQAELRTHHTGELVPRVSSLQSAGQALVPYGGWIWDICCFHRECRDTHHLTDTRFLDRQTPIELTGSHYSQLCRRPGLWSTQELVVSNSKTPCYLVWA